MTDRMGIPHRSGAAWFKDLVRTFEKFFARPKHTEWVPADPYVSNDRAARKAAQLVERRAAQDRARQNGKGRR